MKKEYRDHRGRTAPPRDGEMYIGNVRRGSLVTWGVGKPVKVVDHSPGCTRVTRRGLKTHRVTVGTAEVKRYDPDRTFNVSPGTIVRRANGGRASR